MYVCLEQCTLYFYVYHLSVDTIVASFEVGTFFRALVCVTFCDVMSRAR